MNEEESIASRSQALTWEQLTYYRQHGWFIWAPYLCDLVLPLPTPTFHLQTNKLVLQTAQTSWCSWFRSWHLCLPIGFCPASLLATRCHFAARGMGLLRQLWQPEFFLQWQSSLERTDETFFSNGGPRTLGEVANAARPLEGMLGTAQHLFAFSCQYHPGFRSHSFVVGAIMRH